MTGMTLHQVGPGVTVQDLGRPGYLAQGLSRGGAADPMALYEGAALLSQPVGAALEMVGFGGVFTFDGDQRIALSGAPMRASVDGSALRWNASHLIPAGAKLDIGGTLGGVYGYLTLGGGLDLPPMLSSYSAHLAAGLGAALKAGDHLPLVADPGQDVGTVLDIEDRLSGGEMRILPSLQTDLFPQDMRIRFTTESFTRDSRANRMGARLEPDGAGYGLAAGQSILSEIITRGDIQIPGDGAPYVLLSECQTTGGYPRIGTVIPADLPRIAQAPAGAQIRFRFVTRDEALAAERTHRAHIKSLPSTVRPLVRDPHQMQDLLSYTLISGVTAGEELS
jgi:allophanate hydrolase